MGWTSSTAVVSAGANGAISTTSNNALIEGNGSGWNGDYLEVYGANDTVIGSWHNDSIGAVMYPALGMNGNNAYIEGGTGNDVLFAAAMQGEQNVTLDGGIGIDPYIFGCNVDSTLNVELVVDSFDLIMSPAVFYEGYQPGCFTCYSTDSGLLITDNAGRLTVKLDGITDYNSIANGTIWLYPYGVRTNSGLEAATIVAHNGSYVTAGSAIRYGGVLTGLSLNGNTLSVNDWHSGGVVTNGVYGYDNLIVIDDTQSTQGRYLGGNSQANQIYAGSGGDTLWGAANNDILFGGAGADNFLYGAGEGADLITNADALDTVILSNMRLSDIAAVAAENNTITLAQDASNAVTIQFNGTLSPAIQLADGARYRYDNTTAAWQAS